MNNNFSSHDETCFAHCGVGIGALALTRSTLARCDCWRRSGVALSRQGETRHSSVHEWRSKPRRYVRPERSSPATQRQIGTDEEPADRAADRQRDAVALQVSRITASADCPSARSVRQHRPAHGRHLRHPLDARRRAKPRTVVDVDEHRRIATGSSEHGIVAHLRTWAARTKICRPL